MPAYDGKDGAEKLLEVARKRFRLCVDAEADQRRNEREDLAFRGEGQWTPAAIKERKGGEVAGVATPPRPLLTIDLIQQPDQLLFNQANKAELGVKLNAAGEDASDELVEIKQDLYRRIQRDGGAHVARMWAFDRAKRCGRGWYRVVTQYDEDAGDSFDQEIAFKRILHQESVYMDPTCQEADFSDARYAFVVAWKTKDEVEREFPDAELSHGSGDWEGMDETAPDWVRAGTEGDEYLIAEYWFKTYERETLCLLSNGEVIVKGPDYNVPKGVEVEQERSREKVTVFQAKLCGNDVLQEPLEWNGKYFPLIPVIGREQQPVDGKRFWEGLVRPAIGAQRFANFAASTLVEAMAMEPKITWQVAEGQDEGYEHEYAQANIRNLAVMHYRPTSLDGKPVPPPQRVQVDSSKMQLSLMAWGEAKGFVQQTTSIHAYALGEQGTGRDPQSGKAILALQQQSDAGSSQYLDNLGNITLPYEGKVVLDLMPHIYDRPGRITQVLGKEDKSKTVMLNAPFVMNGQRPKRVNEGTPGAEQWNLADGKYTVSVDVGRPYQTRLQEAGDMIGQLLAKAPQLMPIIGPTYLRTQDWPGAEELADLLQKVRDQQFPFLGEDEEGQPTPDVLKSQIGALQQQLQGMGMQMQAAMKALETDQAKQQAQILKAQMDNESRERIAAANNETKIAIEGFAQRMVVLEQILAKLADREARHEEMAHDKAMAAAGGQSMTVSRSRGQDGEREGSQEMSDGDTREHAEEDQPPQASA